MLMCSLSRLDVALYKILKLRHAPRLWRRGSLADARLLLTALHL